MALRRSPMPRGTKPLKATKPLERHTGLAQVGRKRREQAEAAGKPVKPALTTKHRPTVPVDTRAALAERSGGICEIQMAGCTGLATEVSHRRTQGMGGRHGAAKVDIDRLSDILHACHAEHMWAHARFAEAQDLGIRLYDWQNPLMEPVLYRGVLSYLNDDGLVIDFEEVGA